MNDKTYREAIVETIRDDIALVDGIEQVEIDRSTVVNIDTAPMASCFVYAGPETRVTADNEATLGFETWDMVIVIEVWAYKSDIEYLLAKIHRVINDNRYLTSSSYICNSNPSGRLLSGTGIKRTGADPQYFEATNEKKAMIVPFEARYRHVIGDMFVPLT
jgi:hypothetical protein